MTRITDLHQDVKNVQDTVLADLAEDLEDSPGF